MGSVFDRNINLKRYNTFNVGGNALYLTECQYLEQLCNAISESAFRGVILGRGSNILVSDSGYNGHIIINRAENVLLDDGTVLCYSGKSLSSLAAFYTLNSLSGLEWASSIPGSVGGAAIMNAGAYGGCFADSVIEVLVFNEFGKRWVSCHDCGFGYRTSKLSGAVLAARLKYTHCDKQQIKQKALEFVAKRREQQPVGASAGSVFKGAEKPAGWYIEQAGLKGFRVGGASISTKHANFIINDGGALASDIKQIINTIKGVVYDRFNVKLYEEIKYLGEF